MSLYKILNIGLTAAIVISIPITIVYIQQQQNIRQQASSEVSNPYNLYATCIVSPSQNIQQVDVYWQKVGTDKFYEFSVMDAKTNEVVSTTTVPSDGPHTLMPQFPIDANALYKIHMWVYSDQNEPKMDTRIQVPFSCQKS